MSNQEILIRAIEKAIAGGFQPNNFAWIPEDYQALIEYWFTADNYKAVIFNHDFARALWGDGEQRKYNGFNFETGEMLTDEEKDKYIPKATPLWQHHIQQMAIADDPIEYLGENL